MSAVNYQQWIADAEHNNVLFWQDGDEFVLYGEKGCFVWTDSKFDGDVNALFSRLNTSLYKNRGCGWYDYEVGMRFNLGDMITDSFLSFGA